MVRPAAPRPRPGAQPPTPPPAGPPHGAHHTGSQPAGPPHASAMAGATADEGSSDDCTWCADVCEQLVYALQATIAYWRTVCGNEGTDRADCANAVRSALDVIYPKL